MPDYTNETDAEYEHRRKQQFLRDVQRYEESKDDKGEWVFQRYGLILSRWGLEISPIGKYMFFHKHVVMS